MRRTDLYILSGLSVIPLPFIANWGLYNPNIFLKNSSILICSFLVRQFSVTFNTQSFKKQLLCEKINQVHHGP